MRRSGRKSVVQFVFFNAGGIAFFVVGYATFSVLYGLLRMEWLPAKIIGDTLGWSVNFALQYFAAFREERRGHKPHVVIGKFTGLSLINLGIDYGIVALLKLAGVTPLIGLIVASQFFTVWKWLWYKYWVFRVKPVRQLEEQ